jgi:uncharacterized protein YgiM (DUF1202 family)
MLSFSQSKALFIAAAIASFSLSLVSYPVFGKEQTVAPDKVEALKEQTKCSFINIKSGTVNIRKGPGNQHRVIAKLKRGDGVRAVSRQGNWVKIAARFTGTSPNETFVILDGWVNNQYINGCSEDQFDMWRK